jgi:hypothetical protein
MEENEKVVNPEEKQEKKKRKPINTGKGGLFWSIWHFAEAALFIVLGVLAIVFSDNSDLQSSFLIIVGAFIIADGALRILMNFMPLFGIKDKKDLSFNFAISGSVELAVGITLIVENGVANTIATFLSYFIAIIALVGAAALIAFAIGFIVTKLYKLYMPILEIVLGLALAAIGIFILIKMDPNNGAAFYRVVLIIIGVIIILSGIMMLVGTIATISLENKKKKILKAAEAYADGGEAKEEAHVTEVDLTDTPKEEKEEDKKDEEPKAIEENRQDVVDADSSDTNKK